MTTEEFTDWIAYFSIEPHGYQIDTWRFGMLAASICNSVLSTIPIQKGGKKPKRYKDSDFYPTFGNQDEFTPEQRAHLNRKKAERKRKRKQNG